MIPEDWGGSTIFVPVSAKTHQGIEELLEMILLTSEVCELKANPKRNATGTVIEAKLTSFCLRRIEFPQKICYAERNLGASVMLSDSKDTLFLAK